MSYAHRTRIAMAFLVATTGGLASMQAAADPYEDALTRFRDMMMETTSYGLEKVRDEQQQLGDKVRALLAAKGIKSVAAEGFQAPGVVVSYTSDPGIQNGKKFAEAGLQIAAGVPLRCDEPDEFHTFRLGLFGLDKLHNIDRTVEALADAISRIS